MSEADKQDIKELVKASKDGLASDDQAMIRRSREALVRHLRTSGVTSAFRNSLSTELIPVIKPLAADARDANAINALRLAGELGTRDGLSVLETGLKDKRASVRAMAAFGYARAFGTTQAGPTPLVQAHTDPALAVIAAAADVEQDPRVLDALVSAVENGMKMPDPTMHAKAIDTVAAMTSKLAPRPVAADANAALTSATKAMFDVVSGKGAGAAKLNTVQNKEFGGAAGESIARAIRVVDAGPLSDSDRATLAMQVRNANLVYAFAAKALTGKDPVTYKPAEALADGDDAQFKKEAMNVIEALHQAPFSFPADRFKTK